MGLHLEQMVLLILMTSVFDYLMHRYFSFNEFSRQVIFCILLFSLQEFVKTFHLMIDGQEAILMKDPLAFKEETYFHCQMELMEELLIMDA